MTYKEKVANRKAAAKYLVMMGNTAIHDTNGWMFFINRAERYDLDFPTLPPPPPVTVTPAPDNNEVTFEAEDLDDDDYEVEGGKVG